MCLDHSTCGIRSGSRAPYVVALGFCARSALFAPAVTFAVHLVVTDAPPDLPAPFATFTVESCVFIHVSPITKGLFEINRGAALCKCV